MSKNDEILLKLTDAQWSSATIKCEKSFSILWHSEIVKMLKHLLGNRKVATTVVSHLSSSAHSACYTSYRLITNKSQLPKMPQNSKEYNFKILNGFIFFWQSKLKHSSLDHAWYHPTAPSLLWPTYTPLSTNPHPTYSPYVPRFHLPISAPLCWSYR